MKVGLLVEKSSQARNFAKALGGMSGTFDGKQYVIVPARGHLYEFKDPEDQVPASESAKYKDWALANLPWDESKFKWSRKKQKDVDGALANIRSNFADCDAVVCSGDVDSSGEGGIISIEIFQELGMLNKPVYRLYFSDEADPRDVQKGFKNMKLIPDVFKHDEYLKAFYRMRWDFLSMQFTRAATKLSGTVLRQGRLKSAMVVIVGDALKALNNYKKIPYYQWRFKDENGNTFASKNEPSVPDKAQLAQKYSISPVIVDSTEQKRKAPPKMMDLATLSGLLAPKGYTAKNVLETYQKCYESGFLSYPRTEETTITPDQFNDLLQRADAIARVIGVDPALLTHRQPRATHVKPGGVHGANRPGLNVPNSLADLNKFGSCAADIYTILAKSFLATLCEDYVYTHQEGHLQNYPEFKGNANAPVSQGYKTIYAGLDDDDDDADGKLLGTMAAPFEYEGFPPKPPTPTMFWLMRQLEKRDVGTGATRTSTYAEVTNASSQTALMKDTRGKISLTECGQMSYLILPGTHIGSLELTEQVYAEMRDVASGKANPDVLLHNIQQMVLDDIQTMKSNMTQVKLQFPDAGSYAPREKISGVFQPTGQKVEFSKEFSGHEYTQAEIDDLLAGKTISFDAVNKAGKPYQATGRLAEQTFKNKTFWGFALEERSTDSDKVEGVYKPKKRKIRFKRVFGGHVFTDQEVADLLAGKEISFQATSKAGKQYTATGKLKEQQYNGVKYWGFAFSN